LKDTDQLRAEWRVSAHCPGHDSEYATLGEGDDRAQKLLGFALRQRDHCLAHDWNAHIVGEPPRDFVAIYESHQTLPYCFVSVLSIVILLTVRKWTLKFACGQNSVLARR
jgi:hypothetical protein